MQKGMDVSRVIKKILARLLTLALLLFFIAVLLIVRDNGISPSITHLKCAGSILYKGETFEVPSISNYVLPENMAKGDTVTLKFVLPSELKPKTVLRFKTYHMMVEVVEDGRVVYSYGKEKQMKGRMVGSGFHYVVLNQQASKHPLEIRFVHAIEGNLSAFSEFDLLPAQYANSDYSSRHVVALAVGVFLLLFGFLSVLIGIGISFHGIRGFRVTMIGFLSCSLGIWTLCYQKLLQIVSYNFAFNTTLEYFSLYFAPIPFFLLLLDMRKGKIASWKWWGTFAFVAVEVAFLLVTTFLHALNVVWYPFSLPFFHVFVAIAFSYLLFFGVLYNRKIDLSGKFLTMGVVVFGCVALLDLMRYHFCKYFLIDNPILDMTWIPFGTLLFVLCLVLSYIIYLFQLLESKAEKDVLSTMAYVDSLTGLFNRAKCQQIFGFLDKSPADYAIVSIDMNGLKLVNDKYGHMAGDTLIKAFANVFKQSLAGIGTAIRMGGDEFLAIVRSEHIAEVESSLAKLLQLQKDCKEELPIPLEAAYGVAYRRECGENATAEVVYQEADKRMYDMKSHMKSNLVRK